MLITSLAIQAGVAVVDLLHPGVSSGLPTPPPQAEIQAQRQRELEQQAEQWRLQKELEEELARQRSADLLRLYEEDQRCMK